MGFSHNGERSHTRGRHCSWDPPYGATITLQIVHLVMWGCTSPGEEAEDSKAKIMSVSHNPRLIRHGSRVYNLG